MLGISEKEKPPNALLGALRLFSIQPAPHADAALFAAGKLQGRTDETRPVTHRL